MIATKIVKVRKTVLDMYNKLTLVSG